jgi:hypothetical protein
LKTGFLNITETHVPIATDRVFLIPENALGICRRAAKKTRVWKKPQVKNLKPSTDQQQQQNRRTNSGQTQN